ncbi:lipid-A-disaccharide synthase [uncultured Megamonas sp.]|uniref:lipid-A-disaccharide synthase n=1 Tax=uncultured Megamonas sp. TaxID=286140 RepID=UPI00266F7014|nr:lipid-A-disaccharide synthase [uncultured Megamonas sp.]
MYKIMFSAGETSGDMHGANLAKALKNLYADIEMFGFGGPQMEQAGVKLCKNMLDYSVMGFWEVLINLRKMFKLKDALVEEMKRQKPDILVLIDYPDFNWRLAREAKKLNIPVFSYIPPSAWAWRKGRAKDVAKIADKIVAIFPFELDVYKQAGADISFVGNPLMDNVKASMSKQEAAKFFDINLNDDNILLLPGSRKQEIANLLEPMLDAAKLIVKERKKARFFLPVATGIDKVYLQEEIAKHKLNIKLCEEKTYDLMNCCDFAIATSGTVTLEAALMGLPSIVLYKMSAITYRIAKIFVKIKYFSLPNILVDRQVLPELLQDEVNGENIAKFARQFYKDTASAKKVKEDLLMVKAKLGSPGVADKTAELILQTVDKFKDKIKE